MSELLHNPDVLTCLANLSNDEVFTPPEIAKRLIAGLAEEFPDLQERIDHIFHRQLYGIAITELTSLISRRSLYCTKYPNSRYSISRFDDTSGNIRFKRILHRWQNGKCVFCGAPESTYKRGEELESHAYEWIHTVKPEEIFGMKFDVIIGNPPYQLSDGGYRVSASPIYQMFVEKAIQLHPRYLAMIIPARWFSGGKGLDSFRDRMLHDQSLRVIHDFPEASDCFSGVQIKGGVCYYLWDRENKGDCAVTTHKGDTVGKTVVRPLLEQDCDVFIRYNEAISILHKVWKNDTQSFESLVSARKPFGLDTLYRGRKEQTNANDIILYENGGISYINNCNILKNKRWVEQSKVFIPEAGSGSDSFPHPILGKPFVGTNNTASTETYLLIGPFENDTISENVVLYIKTRFLSFLVMLKKPSQHATSKVYSFVPIQDFSKSWTDEELYDKYNLTSDEIAFIETMIKPMEVNLDE